MRMSTKCSKKFEETRTVIHNHGNNPKTKGKGDYVLLFLLEDKFQK